MPPRWWSSSSRCRPRCGQRSSLLSRCASASAWRWCRTICPGWRPSWTSSGSSTPMWRCGSACWTTMPWPMGWSRASWTRVWSSTLAAPRRCWRAPPCGQTPPACWCPGDTPSGKRSASRWQSCAGSGCCCPACGRICSARCGRPVPGRALPPMPKSAPAFIRPTIWCRSSCAPA